MAIELKNLATKPNTLASLKETLGINALSGLVAGTFTIALPTGTIPTDKVYAYAGVDNTTIGGITWRNGDFAHYTGSSWVRIPFQSLSNYTLSTDLKTYGKKNICVINNESTIIAFDSTAKTITFPSGISLIDDTVARMFTLGSLQTVSMGAWSQGLVYYNSANDTMNFRGVLTVDEIDSVFTSFHKIQTLYPVAILSSISTASATPAMMINANYYSINGDVYGDGRSYVDGKIYAINNYFNIHSEWYIGDVTKLTTNGAKSVINAVKDIWFDFIEGKPTWWDNGTFKLDCVFRHDYTVTETANDTMFQFVITKDGVPYQTQSFYRWEIEIKGDVGEFTHTKQINLDGIAVLVNIRADISAYSTIIPIPRNDTVFNLFSKLKTTSIYKESEKLEIVKQQVFYAGNEIFAIDQCAIEIFKRGLTVDDSIQEIAICSKTLPLLSNYVATPNDPSALQVLRDTPKNWKMPTYKYGTSMVDLKPDEVGDLIWLNVDFARILNKKVGLQLTVKNKKISDIVNTSVNVMAIGASSTELGIASYIKLLFEEYGLVFNGVGTKYDYFGTLGEGRGGWSFAAYTGISSKINSSQLVNIPTETATITVWDQNPFLFLATEDDKINRGNWCFRRSPSGSYQELSYNSDTDKTGDFYIFDFARYMTSRSVAVPDVITIQLGMNDYYSVFWSGDQKNINVSLSLDIIISQIRAYSQNIQIGIMTYMPRFTNSAGVSSVVGFGNDISNYINILNNYLNTKSDNKLHVINTHCLMNPDFIFDQEEGDVIDDSGNSTAELILSSPGDGVHFQKNGYLSFAKVTGAFVANQMT